MMMTTDQFTASSKTSLEALQSLSGKTFAGFEKLTELNLAAAKSWMSASFDHATSLLSIKDVPQFISLQTSLVAPSAEKAAAYGRHVYGIAIEASAEFTKAFEGKAVEGQKALGQAMDSMTKNAPAGTESALAVLKSALASSQSAIESAQSAARQALALAESNVTDVTEKALSVTAAAGKKA